MATYSSNTTIKYTGTQVAQTRTSTGSIYTVTSGKTLVGAINVFLSSGTATVTIDGTTIAQIDSSGTENVTLPLYANSGAVIACTISLSGRVSVFGVLQENTP
ncbi:MAG: hypothetical protein E6R04_08260 [Spirochaetes bacterium]|nr:MAG: hypothetical protein E6R04_08260 [Spirochaetota bacterium]